MVSINTNDGVERQNETFKYTYLKKHGLKKNGLPLTGVLGILIDVEHF